MATSVVGHAVVGYAVIGTPDPTGEPPPVIRNPRLALTLPTSGLTLVVPSSALVLTLPDSRLELT